MALTSTIDQSPTVIGNLHMLFGTFTEGASGTTGTIDLSPHLTEIVAAGLNANTSGSPSEIHFTTGSTTLNLVYAAGDDGTWWAMGRRG